MAKLRTAEDVVTGTAVHGEKIYVSHELRSEPRPAVATALAGMSVRSSIALADGVRSSPRPLCRRRGAAG